MSLEFWKRLLIAAAASLLLTASASAAQTREAEQHFFNLNTGDLSAEAADARKAGKKALFFMFEQEGCAGCLYMKRNVLNRVDVQAYYRRQFLNFAIDIHGAVPLRDFSGRDHTEKSYAQAARVTGTPTFVFHDLDGKELIRIVGPVKDGAEFLLLGEFIASGAYRSGNFADYKRSRLNRRGS